MARVSELPVSISGKPVKLNVETALGAPIETVAAVLTSAEDAPKWQNHLVRMEVVKGGPNQIGSLARLHYVENGRAYVMEDELVDCKAGRRWRSRVSGNGMTIEVQTELDASDGATIIRLTWDGKPDAWWARLLFPYVKPVLRRHLLGDLRALDRLVRERADEGVP